MAKRKKQLPLLESVTITDVAAEGKAIAKVDGMAVFVPYAVPGDVVDIQLTRKNTITPKGRLSISFLIPKIALNRFVSISVYVAVANGKCFLTIFN